LIVTAAKLAASGVELPVAPARDASDAGFSDILGLCVGRSLTADGAAARPKSPALFCKAENSKAGGEKSERQAEVGGPFCACGIEAVQQAETPRMNISFADNAGSEHKEEASAVDAESARSGKLLSGDEGARSVPTQLAEVRLGAESGSPEPLGSGVAQSEGSERIVGRPYSGGLRTVWDRAGLVDVRIGVLSRQLFDLAGRPDTGREAGSMRDNPALSASLNGHADGESGLERVGLEPSLSRVGLHDGASPLRSTLPTGSDARADARNGGRSPNGAGSSLPGVGRVDSPSPSGDRFTGSAGAETEARPADAGLIEVDRLELWNSSRAAARREASSLRVLELGRGVGLHTPASIGGERSFSQVVKGGETQGVLRFADLIDGLGEKIAFMARTDESRAIVRLHPPELGKVEIRLKLVGRGCRAEILVQNIHVKTLIESHAAELAQGLQNADMELSDLSVALEQGDDGRRFFDDGCFAQGRASSPMVSEGKRPSRPRGIVRLEEGIVDIIA